MHVKYRILMGLTIRVIIEYNDSDICMFGASVWWLSFSYINFFCNRVNSLLFLLDVFIDFLGEFSVELL